MTHHIKFCKKKFNVLQKIAVVLTATALFPACAAMESMDKIPASAAPSAADRERADMVDREIANRGIYQSEVLEALRKTPRTPFVDPALVGQAQQNRALPMLYGRGRLLALPFRTAEILQALELNRSLRVLEVGAGIGYRAALLAHLAGDVYALEADANLAREAQRLLYNIGLSNVQVQQGDESSGWPEAAPFDRILISDKKIVNLDSLMDQLADGGLLVTLAQGGSLLHVFRRLNQNQVERLVVPLKSH